MLTGPVLEEGGCVISKRSYVHANEFETFLPVLLHEWLGAQDHTATTLPL
jgi:hypothetical protein